MNLKPNFPGHPWINCRDDDEDTLIAVWPGVDLYYESSRDEYWVAIHDDYGTFIHQDGSINDLSEEIPHEQEVTDFAIAYHNLQS